MQFTRSTSALIGCFVLLSALAPQAAESQAKKKKQAVAEVRVLPSGATLRPGDTQTFAAVAVDKTGAPVPDVSFRWTAKPRKVVELIDDGKILANREGTGQLIARAGGKNAKLSVSVVSTPSQGNAYVASGFKQANHLLADDQWVYWTEVDGKFTRVRKTPKNGGPIYDVAVERSRDKRGLRVSYVHLQQSGDTLYWSRQSLGYLPHWTILAIPKAGGEVTTILPDDISTRSFTQSGWRIVGRKLLATLQAPGRLNLPQSTRLAAYDLDTGVWTPLLMGGYEAGNVWLVATDDQSAYVRGETSDGTVRILRVALDGSEIVLLNNRAQRDPAITEPGVVVGANLYFWSGHSSERRLMSLPITGGALTSLWAGNGPLGLSTDGTYLYWGRTVKKALSNLVRMPVNGGDAMTVLSSVFSNTLTGDLAADDQNYYAVIREKKLGLSIIRVAR